MDFSRFFDLGKTEAELDFVNVDPERDAGLQMAVGIRAQVCSTINSVA